jgi:hypothetical protein
MNGYTHIYMSLITLDVTLSVNTCSLPGAVFGFTLLFRKCSEILLQIMICQLPLKVPSRNINPLSYPLAFYISNK